MASYQVTMDEETFRLFAVVGKKMNCPNATTLLGMAVEALANKVNMDTVVQGNKKFIEQIDDNLLHPANFDGADAVFGPPAGIGEDEVYSLCAAKVNWAGAPAVVTCWKPTRFHIKDIKKTGRIWVSQMAQQPNPVCVSAKNPLEFQQIDLL